MHIDNTDKVVWPLLDLMLITLASSTVAYEIVLFSRLPLWVCYPFFAIANGILLFCLIRSNSPIRAIKIDANIITLFALGVFCALINVFTIRPDADDFSYFHRAVYGLLHLENPVAIFHTAHDIKNLPPISPVHLTTSFEVMTALFAHALGVQPLFFYQILNGSFFLFFFPIVYYAFFRYFGFSNTYSFVGSVIVVFLYVFSGDSHQDFGNFTIVRAWQGKCVLIFLFVPLTSLLSYRFIQSSSLRDLLRLHLAAICSIGLSGSAFFVIPFMIAFSFLSTISTQWNNPELFRKVVLLSTTITSFALVAAFVKFGHLPQISNTDVWQMNVIPGILPAMRPEILMLERTIFVKNTTLYFYFISILGLLVLPVKNKTIRALGIASLLISISLVLPPISHLLIKITLPGGYWRLAYTTQMLLVIGVFALVCLQSVNEVGRFKKLALRIFGIFFLIFFAALKFPAVKPSIIAGPHQLKFTPSEIEVGRLLEMWVPGNSTALIPEQLINAAGLLRPDISLVSTRGLETLHVFLNSGRKNSKNEAELRVAAQKDLGHCGVDGMVAKIVDEIPTVNLLVFPSSCNPKTIENNVHIHHEEWSIKSTATYQVWLKNA